MLSGELRFLRAGKKPRFEEWDWIRSQAEKERTEDLDPTALLELNALSPAESPRSASWILDDCEMYLKFVSR
jgi:hypothetical protein